MFLILLVFDFCFVLVFVWFCLGLVFVLFVFCLFFCLCFIVAVVAVVVLLFFFCLFFVVFGRTKVLSVQIISELVIAVFRFLSGSKFNLLGLLMALKTYQPSF